MIIVPRHPRYLLQHRDERIARLVGWDANKLLRTPRLGRPRAADRVHRAAAHSASEFLRKPQYEKSDREHRNLPERQGNEHQECRKTQSRPRSCDPRKGSKKFALQFDQN